MEMKEIRTCTAFEGCRCLASGTLTEVARKVKEALGNEEQHSILIFDENAELIEVDFRGTIDDVLQRLEKANGAAGTSPELEKNAQRGPGRPRLGVVCREVSLLPRHWEWLNSQPGGASVALRRLVEEARVFHRNRDKVRRAQEVTYRFMTAVAGDMPGYEEALRALFAGNAERLDSFTAEWPDDIGNHIQKISGPAFGR
jgi:uncharacterized protein